MELLVTKYCVLEINVIHGGNFSEPPTHVMHNSNNGKLFGLIEEYYKVMGFKSGNPKSFHIFFDGKDFIFFAMNSVGARPLGLNYKHPLFWDDSTKDLLSELSNYLNPYIEHGE